MKAVRLRNDLMRADGAKFRAGSIFYVVREFDVNQGREQRLCLGYRNGDVVIPCCDPAETEALL